MSVPINTSTVFAQLAVSVVPKKTEGAANVIPFAFDETRFPKRPIPPEGIESLAEGLEREEMPPMHLGLPSAPDRKNVVGQAKESEINPAALMTLRDQGADIKQLLLAMNKIFAVAKYGSKIVVASIIGNDLIFMTDDDFHKMFANLVVFEEIKDKNGATKTTAVKVSKRWFEWKDRRQYFGRGVVFEPGGPPEIPNDMLNLWRGFGITPKPGDWSLMRDHIFNVVCSGKQEHFDYLIRLMACGVQHLDKPLGVAVALLGAQRTGKGVVARTFGRFFGKHFVHIAHSEHLTGTFNALIGCACVVFLDEALWAGDKKGEGVLKALITEPSFPFQAKFRDTIMVENRLRIFVASNNDWAVPAGIGDRRWFVLNVAGTYAGTGHRDYWNALYTELDNGGEAAMLYELRAMDLSGFDVRVTPHTAAKGLLEIFCEVHFGKKKTKPVKWDILNMLDVAKDYSIAKKRNPEMNEEGLCKELRKTHKDKYGHYNVDALRKIVRKATNPRDMALLRYPEIKDPLLKVIRADYEKKGVKWTPELERALSEILSAIDFDTLGRI